VGNVDKGILWKTFELGLGSLQGEVIRDTGDEILGGQSLCKHQPKQSPCKCPPKQPHSGEGAIPCYSDPPFTHMVLGSYCLCHRYFCVSHPCWLHHSLQKCLWESKIEMVNCWPTALLSLPCDACPVWSTVSHCTGPALVPWWVSLPEGEPFAITITSQGGQDTTCMVNAGRAAWQSPISGHGDNSHCLVSFPQYLPRARCKGWGLTSSCDS
jgi:hypothetical protein